MPSMNSDVHDIVHIKLWVVVKFEQEESYSLLKASLWNQMGRGTDN